MKTFEQFRAWMKDNHLWTEYLYEFCAYRRDDKICPRSLYESWKNEIISESFPWESTAGRYDFWKSVDKKMERIF